MTKSKDVENKPVLTVAVRLTQLVNLLEQNQSALKVKTKELKEAAKALDGSAKTVNFEGRALSAYLVPLEHLPEDVRKALKGLYIQEK